MSTPCESCPFAGCAGCKWQGGVSDQAWRLAIENRHLRERVAQLEELLEIEQMAHRVEAAALREATTAAMPAMGALRGSVAVCSPGVARGDLDQKRGAEGRTETRGLK